MKNAAIFGCEAAGRRACLHFKSKYRIVAFLDNPTALYDFSRGAAAVEALQSVENRRSRAEDLRPAYAHFHRPFRLAEFVCGADAIQAAAPLGEPCLA